jgi:uncharacterized protein YndB with AHSA1/START domain
MTISKSIKVERPPQIAFRVFCEEIGQWWPKGPSFNGKRLIDMIIEGRVGGRFYEIHDDESQYEIGQVTAYEPPNVVALTWRAPGWDVPTRVEIRFIADGTGTRVELDHSGWEREPKSHESRKNYDSGWDFIIRQYQARANSAG